MDLSRHVVVGEPVQKSSIRWSVPYNVKDAAGNRAHTVWRDVVVEEVDLANVEARVRQEVLQTRKAELWLETFLPTTFVSEFLGTILLLFGMIVYVLFSLVTTNKNISGAYEDANKGRAIQNFSYRSAMGNGGTLLHTPGLLSPRDLPWPTGTTPSSARNFEDEILKNRSLITPSRTGDGVRSRRAHCGSNWRLG